MGSNDPQLSASVPWPVVEKPTMGSVNARKVEKEAFQENVSSGDSEESTNSEQLSSISTYNFIHGFSEGEPRILTRRT